MIYYLSFLLFLFHSTTASVELILGNNNNSSKSDTFEKLEKVQGNILCRSCGNDVASSKDLISKLSPNALHSFRDTIFDKDNVLIQVVWGNFILDYPVVIAKSSNCIPVQEWEESVSWFPGYRWKPCVCPDCGEYIGWVFESIDSDSTDSSFVETPSTFLALIISNLIGESCKYILFSCEFSDCVSWKIAQLNMSTTDTMSAEDKEFLASCEEQFKGRYSERDTEFMKVFNSEPSTPPIIESWWVPQNSGRRNDRRHNRRNHPYERNDGEYDRGNRRGYSDYNDDDRGQSYRNHRPRYY